MEKIHRRFTWLFQRDGGKKPVSVEMSVYKMKKLDEEKYELLDFKYEGITILGSFVTPAIPCSCAGVIICRYSRGV